LTEDDERVALEASLDKKIYVEVPDAGGTLRAVQFDPAQHSDPGQLLKRFVAVQGPDGVPIRELVYGCNARKQVRDFRASNPWLAGPAGLWRTLGAGLEDAARKREDFTIELPDGGVLRYKNCRFEERRRQDPETGEWYTKREVRFDMGARSESTYSGKLCENCVQATARNVFVESALRCEAAGFRFLWSIHDEAVFEVPDDGTPFGTVQGFAGPNTIGKIVELFAQTPSWAEGLPVAAEAVYTDRYLK
jgi:hypothetical protein